MMLAPRFLVFSVPLLVAAGCFAGDAGQSFKGTPIVIPSTVQCVDFDKGGEGVAFRNPDASTPRKSDYRAWEGVVTESTRDGSGGFVVSGTSRGMWLNYTVDVKQGGTYLIEARVATTESPGGYFHLEFGGQDVTGSITAPCTRDWQVYQTVIALADLKPGVQVMRLCMDRGGAGKNVANFNWIRFKVADDAALAAVKADETVRKAKGLLLQNKPNAALAMVNTALAECAGNAPSMATLLKGRGDMYVDLKQLDSAVADYEAARSQTVDKDRQDEIVNAVQDSLIRANRVEQAAEYYGRITKDVATDKQRLARSLAQQADIFFEKLKRYDEAARVYERIVNECSSEKEAVADAENKLVECAVRREDYPAAASQLRSLVKARAQHPNPKLRAQTRVRLAEVLALARSFDESRRLYQELMGETYDSETQANYLLRIGKGCLEEKAYAEAIAVSQRLLTSYPLLTERCAEALKGIYSVYMDQQAYEKALVAAARYYGAAKSAASIKDASLCITQTLRAVDGNLVRTNEYLKFQMLGPAGEDKKLGTADDLKNPLAALFGDGIAPSAEEVKLLDGALAKFAKDPRSCACILLYFGKPRQALSEFKKIHIACPVGDKNFQQTVDDMLIALKGINGHVFDGPVLAEYLTYGPKGKSGQEQLTDPLKGF